ncbi:MAG TPA: glycosyltransferase [Blastocatellia bacterium]|nr:glycosyltransferase [Blastocatellia bacterium]
MMRVLHVYSGNLYGGVERMLVTLASHRELCAGVEPGFALSFEGRLSRELAETGAALHMLGKVRASRPATLRRARREFAKLLRSARYDVVICHSVWAQAIFGPEARRYGAPLVFWLHDAAGGRHWLERWARLTPPALAICNSRFTAGTLPSLYPRARAEVIHCPVPVAEPRADRASARDEMKVDLKTAVIIQASRLERWKGHSVLIDALARLKERTDWVCWQVGGPQRKAEAVYLESLKDRAARLGIADRVRFLGQREDVPRLLAAADIHCQPNTGPEPFGIAFIEALAAGLPVVTTAIGGAAEIVDDQSGRLVQPDDAGGLKSVLGELLEDASLRKRLGSNGPARARAISDPASQLARLARLLDGVARDEAAA